MLKFEGIAIGTTIKAYDFEPCPGRDDQYVIGPIIDIATNYGAKCYVIDCTKDSVTIPGEVAEWRVGQEIHVPMETTMDFDNRVTPLDGPCAPKSALMKELAEELGLEVIDLSLSK